MPSQALLKDVLKLIDVDQDPVPYNKDGDQFYHPIVDPSGDLPGLMDTDFTSVYQRSLTKIAREIEQAFDYKFVWKGELPVAFAAPYFEVSEWSWDLSWAFYFERFLTIKFEADCEITDDFSPMTLWLLHLYFTAKNKGRCHFFGIHLVITPKHPSRVMFGKRNHDKIVSSGWTGATPVALTEFTDRRCNLVPESISAYQLRSKLPKSDLEEFMRTIVGSGGPGGRGWEFVGMFEGLKLDDDVAEDLLDCSKDGTLPGERWFTTQPVQGEDRQFRIVAIKSGFLPHQETSEILPTPLVLKNKDATEAREYCLWLNKRYSICRRVDRASKDFGHYVDVKQAYPPRAAEREVVRYSVDDVLAILDYFNVDLPAHNE
ncbi:hypothetical protein V865_001948 [Kwoniella europaea PYCC6329]|uniref:HNH nuclease domain-containing protein n=1 Tax=Kwoniella europaea PYCC6329 TaxID=1423913 RepID=A0AAX4KDZ2_9TREE